MLSYIKKESTNFFHKHIEAKYFLNEVSWDILEFKNLKVSRGSNFLIHQPRYNFHNLAAKTMLNFSDPDISKHSTFTTGSQTVGNICHQVRHSRQQTLTTTCASANSSRQARSMSSSSREDFMVYSGYRVAFWSEVSTSSGFESWPGRVVLVPNVVFVQT